MAARALGLRPLEGGIQHSNLDHLTPLEKQQFAQMQQEIGAQQLSAHELYQIELLKRNPTLTVEEM